MDHRKNSSNEMMEKNYVTNMPNSTQKKSLGSYVAEYYLVVPFRERLLYIGLI